MRKQLAKIKASVKGVVLKLKRNKKNDSRSSGFPLIDAKLKHRLMAAISYLNVLVLIPFIFGKKHGFIAYHARQGLALAIFWSIGIFLFWLPLFGWFAVLFTLIGIVIGLINVFTGKEKPLPLIGKWAVAH